MSPTTDDYAWLPDHQLHVAATLAHVDQTIDHAVRMIHDYTAQEPLSLSRMSLTEVRLTRSSPRSSRCLR